MEVGNSGQKRRLHQANRGQIIILAAGALVALIAMVGLATDLGYNFAQRRTMQNSADAAALAGSHAMAKANPLIPSSVLTTVQSAATANELGGSTPTVQTCQYVNDNDQDLGSCALTIPATATGVRVITQETHETFFMRAVPGAPDSLSTRASATAHVQMLKNPPTDGPFLVCGIGTKVDSGPNVTILTKVGTTYILNSAAVTTSTYTGPNYQIYGPQVSQCGLPNSSYKGLALGTSNQNRTIPGYFYYTTGDNAGGLAADVAGVQGCSRTQIVNCVAFLPVAVDANPDASNRRLWTVMILPFYITGTPTGNGNYNKLNGRIMGDYISAGEGQTGWTPGTLSPVVVRLTK